MVSNTSDEVVDVVQTWDIRSGERTVKIAFAASEKLSTLKEKNLLPAGANSFLLE